MDDFVYEVSSNVRRIGVKIEQKKALYAVFQMLFWRHTTILYLRFSTQISLFIQLSYGEILFWIFSMGAYKAKFLSVTFFALSIKHSLFANVPIFWSKMPQNWLIFIGFSTLHPCMSKDVQRLCLGHRVHRNMYKHSLYMWTSEPI